MLRGAVIGLGNVAIHGHLPGWLGRSDVRIVAAADARPAQRARCEELLPGARWYDSPEDLLAGEPLDFVDICTPPSSHAPFILGALQRGLHVLCEKPLVSSPEDLRRVAEAAAAAGRVLHTVHNWHHAPILRMTGDLIRQGEIGGVRRIVWETLRVKPAAAGDGRDGNWRVDPAVAGGGVLTDHGWHVFYVLPAWVGARPTGVGARLETRRHTAFAVEDTASVRLSFPEASVDILLTWAADERRNRVTVDGSEGRIELRDDTLVLEAGGGVRQWPGLPALSDGSHHPDWFHKVADQFLAAVAGDAPAEANLAEAALCAEIEHLARESSRHGGAEMALSPAPALGSRQRESRQRGSRL
jgi:predicted dehydrogenase